MLLKDLLTTALKGITVNRSRSMLTMLGIIIGVGAVVLMVSIGNTFQAYVLDQLASVGTNTLEIFPTGFQKFGGNLDSLTMDDYDAVSRLSTVEHTTPVDIVGKPVTHGKEAVSPLVIGAYPVIFSNYGFKLQAGRLFNQGDLDGAKPVAVLAYQTAIDLFGNQNPVGQKITVGDASYTVIGTLQDFGSLLLSDLNTPVFIPFSTAKADTAQPYLSYIQVKTVGDPSVAQADIVATIRQKHNIVNPGNDPDKDDFIAQSAEQVTSIVNSVTLGLTVFLGLVAAISLLVGGIGIMNIMLVSVTERTKEIGLRKAVGARRRDILLQFLLEAMSLTLIGGAVGVAGGIFFGWLLTAVAAKLLGTIHYSTSLGSIILALLMALSTGLLFGIYPARRAARLSPMEALRYE